MSFSASEISVITKLITRDTTDVREPPSLLDFLKKINWVRFPRVSLNKSLETKINKAFRGFFQYDILNEIYIL